MTSSATTQATGAGGQSAEGRGYGLVLFASILLAVSPQRRQWRRRQYE